MGVCELLGSCLAVASIAADPVRDVGQRSDETDPCSSANGIHENVDECCPPCISGLADRRQNCGDSSSDICAQDDRNSGLELKQSARSHNDDDASGCAR